MTDINKSTIGATQKAYFIVKANNWGIDPVTAALAFDGNEQARAKVRAAQQKALSQ